jgi:hypothetical protein
MLTQDSLALFTVSLASQSAGWLQRMEHPYGKGLYTPANGRSVYGAGCAKFGNSTQFICMEQTEYYPFSRMYRLMKKFCLLPILFAREWVILLLHISPFSVQSSNKKYSLNIMH